MAQEKTNGNIAQLANVTAFGLLVHQVVNRNPNLPPLGVFYGRSGLGKTQAGISAAHMFKAYYVAFKSLWTKKKFFQSVLQEMEIKPTGTIADMYDQVCEQLALSGRPLIIDDAQYLAERNMMEIIKDIAEGSNGAVILIGEEALPHALKRWERIDNRVLVWEQAKPCTLEDCRILLPRYAAGLEASDSLLEKICVAVKGCTRRVCVNLNNMREYAAENGLEALDVNNYKLAIDTGSARG